MPTSHDYSISWKTFFPFVQAPSHVLLNVLFQFYVSWHVVLSESQSSRKNSLSL